MMKMDLGAGTTPPISVAAAEPDEETTGNFINATKDKKVFKQGNSSLYSCSGDEDKRIDIQEISNLLTQQAMAIGYGKLGLRVFPCNKDKSPIVDSSLGFKHGVKDATNDVKRISRTWFKYPDAAIGFAIPPDIIVIDCDVRKDSSKRPLLKNGQPDMIGLRKFQCLVMEFNITGDPLYTLSVSTQSGGRHFYYRMPEGVSSFNHTSAMEGLDLKGYGGYVILPNSQGAHGKYEFLNQGPIQPIPEKLLKWVLRVGGKKEAIVRVSHETQEIEYPRVEEFVNEILPAWNSAIRAHMGNDFRMAIAGTLYHYGWPKTKAKRVMRMLIDNSEIPGLSDKNAVEYTYKNGAAGKPIRGFSTLEKLINKLEGEEHDSKN
ncbi:MAG: bifunctional DNA primase/polymerase [Thermoplasmatales archaeon]|nr:MAG: bifunctional DNA primase/polymerase [Thermoplasmatales archaeon]